MDPGWKPALKGARRLFVPGAARLITRRASALTAMRTYTVGAVLQWIVFGIIVALLNQDLVPTRGVLAVAAFGTFDLLLISVFRRRSLSATDPKALRAAVAQSFFLGFGFSQISVFFGFVGVFVARRGELLLYVTGVAFGLAGLAMIAPTRARLARIQEHLRAEGSTLSVVDVLNEPPEPPPARPARDG